ncbi:MAG: GNAT family N-acetyltransferase [Candidatus Azambacteria bacterium]|nr:GNAT family N-acetyltransferase [Candidatus Azambacteria bacterium]
MTIRSFSESHKKSLYQLCELLNKKYPYDNHIPPHVLSFKDFQGFVAISGDGTLIGFVGVVFKPEYAFIFGLRVHPDFLIRDVGSLLYRHITEYALKKSSVLKSAFLIENEAMQIITLNKGWRIIDKYLIVARETPFENYNQPISVFPALREELNEIINFVIKVGVGQKEYDQMFLRDKIWHPTAYSKEIFEELIISKNLLIERVEKNINAVCIVNKENNSDDNIKISRIWGRPEPLIDFIVKNYHPKKIKVYIGEVEKEKWQKLGFLTNLSFYKDDLFESKYALIEKRR